jgi:hypothetical protein
VPKRQTESQSRPPADFGSRATLRPARSDLASCKNLVLWAFLGVLTGCVNRLTLSVKAYLGRQEECASETSLQASPFADEPR